MLDKNEDGRISWGEARYWFRCIGWCCTDGELDEVLRSSGKDETDKATNFTVEELQALAGSARKEGRLASQAFLQDRLTYMCGSAYMNRDALKELLTTTGEPIGEEDFDELMNLTEFKVKEAQRSNLP